MNEVASFSQAVAEHRFRRACVRTLHHLTMAAVGVVLIGLLTLFKSETIYRTHENMLLLGYAIFVTIFELSRIAGAALYRSSINRIMDHAERIEARAPQRYEPFVTFVVPCKNEGPAIEHTIEQCFAAEYPADKLEVIVINDGSTDDTGKVLRLQKRRFAGRLTVVSWKDNRGKRRGMAEGFRRAKGEIIIQLDSDSYIKPSTVRNLIKPFVHADIGAVCAHADPANADKNVITRMQAAYYFVSFRILKSAESVMMSVMCCSGCSSAYRKSVVMPILDRWLNERFLGRPVTWGDDRALTNWVIRRGYKTIYTDRARAYTICPETLRQFFKQQTRWKKSWVINAIFASKFIIVRRPFVALTYFFPLIFVSLATPFVAFRALVYGPAMTQVWPLYYLAGVFLLAAIITVFYRMSAPANKYWPYVFVWSGINCFMSVILFYAIVTIQNRGWGTR